MNRLILLLIPVLLISCSTAGETMNDDQAQKSWSGSQSGVQEAENVVIKDAGSWAALWKRIHGSRRPAPEVPRVDFTSQMVVGSFLGQRPSGGYNVSIAGVSSSGDVTTVTVVTKSPAIGAMVTQVITSPYALKVVPTSDKEVVFKQVAAK